MPMKMVMIAAHFCLVWSQCTMLFRPKENALCFKRIGNCVGDDGSGGNRGDGEDMLRGRMLSAIVGVVIMQGSDLITEENVCDYVEPT